jgi:ribulose-phosphate 3-epimerase
MKCAVSLWSADLANLESEMRRLEPYADRFHIDVSDGHYVRNLLFFPDLVGRLRRCTAVPFEVHLMTEDPLYWTEPFSRSGADIVIFSLDSTPDPHSVIDRIRSLGRKAGISLPLACPLDSLDPYWHRLDVVSLVGTVMGFKGMTMSPEVLEKTRRAREIVERRGLRIDIEADGGIRKDTVPLLAEAGADLVVAGSLICDQDPAEVAVWLASLGRGS